MNNDLAFEGFVYVGFRLSLFALFDFVLPSFFFIYHIRSSLGRTLLDVE